MPSKSAPPSPELRAARLSRENRTLQRSLSLPELRNLFDQAPSRHNDGQREVTTDSHSGTAKRNLFVNLSSDAKNEKPGSPGGSLHSKPTENPGGDHSLKAEHAFTGEKHTIQDLIRDVYSTVNVASPEKSGILSLTTPVAGGKLKFNRDAPRIQETEGQTVLKESATPEETSRKRKAEEELSNQDRSKKIDLKLDKNQYILQDEKIVLTFNEVRNYVEQDKTIKMVEFSERYRLAVVSAKQMLNQADQVRTQYPKEVDQFKHYFLLHYERVAQSLQATRDHFGSGDFHDLDDTNLMTLDHAVTGLKKALKRIDFRVKYPTAQDVLLSHTIPGDSMEYFQGFQDVHWRRIAEKRAKKEGVQFTEEYYLQYKEDLAEKSRLSDGHPLWVCREFATFEAGLDEGCVLSSMEAETSGAKFLRLRGRDPKTRFMEAAEKLFGYTSEELSPEVYFTYMTIGKPKKSWGDVGIRAKPEARQRATKVFYDTSASTIGEKPSSLYARPIPLDQAGIDCFPLKGANLHGNADLNSYDGFYMAYHNTRDPLDFKSIDDIKPWAEAQIHGGITVDDIEEVTFSQPINDKDRREKVKGLLDKYNIKHNL